MNKMWDGRFDNATNQDADDFNSSIHIDNRLVNYDIDGSIAHVEMLGRENIIDKNDADVIKETLIEIKEDISSGKQSIDYSAEDIHMFVEQVLTNRIGDVGKKLHTGRSRNDQVAVDTRMYSKDNLNKVGKLIENLLSTLVKIAEKHINTSMPGYTHMQRAQPVTLAHHIMAYFEVFERDLGRVNDAFKRVDICPLGSAALAGSTYPIDRTYTATKLGFSKASNNSMDGVASRDYISEILSCNSIIMCNLSRFCEEIIMWNTSEFSFITLNDDFATGSSIMPQKKNPDIAELIRGKTGRMYGNLMNNLTMMKSLPLTYNKDMQEDKVALFDSMDNTIKCLDLFEQMLHSVNFNVENMLKACKEGFMDATDAADYLVKKGMPFREAHHVIGRLVKYCIDNSTTLQDISLDVYKDHSDKFEDDIYSQIDIIKIIEARDIKGACAPNRVKQEINDAKARLNNIASKKI